MCGIIAANEVLDVQLCCWLSRLSMSLQEGVWDSGASGG